MIQRACGFVYVWIVCLYWYKLQHNLKLDHWQCEQRFHCSFCWPLILRPAAAHPPFSRAHLYTLSRDRTSLKVRKAGRPWHPRLGVLTSRNYFSQITDKTNVKCKNRKNMVKGKTQDRCRVRGFWTKLHNHLRRQKVVWEQRKYSRGGEGNGGGCGGLHLLLLSNVTDLILARYCECRVNAR